MDFNPHKLTSFTWESSSSSSMAMEDHHHIILHDHNSFESFWPNYAAFQNHHNIPNYSSISNQLLPSSSLIIGEQMVNHHHHHQVEEDQQEEAEEELGAMKEMMFKIAAMQPVDIDPASIRKPKRRNVRISDDPQSVAARHRRERISEKIGILQRLVPGGTKMDTASMLDEAIRYVKFLKRQIRQLQANPLPSIGVPAPCPGNHGPPAASAAAAASIVGNTYNVGFNNEVIGHD